MKMMDESKHNYEEYIKRQAEKSSKAGTDVQLETATYGKIYCDDLDFFIDFKEDFPAIVYNDALTSIENVSPEPTINMTPLPPKAQRQVNRVHVLDFAGLTEEIGETLTDRIRMVYTGEEGQIGFEANWSGAWRERSLIRGILGNIDFRFHLIGTFWASSSYNIIRDPIGGVTTVDILTSISVRSGTLEGRLAEHVCLVSDDGIMGLSMIAHVLPVIDLDELVKLNICVRLGDTWAWVAPGPEMQPITAAGALEVTEGALDVDEGAQAVPGLVQAPQPPPTVNRSMTQWLSRLEEEVHSLRADIGAGLELGLTVSPYGDLAGKKSKTLAKYP
ncbi:hypothetical protein Tco_0655035 [Tanacetum coccineum]|uniref:Uncharacterized protein n=1 Tax=Tanacetum coccineum TaxID=301880 RepID=A0ABQ4X4W9_9ASTR